VVTARATERFRELRAGVQTASIPGFLDYDAAVAQYWPRLAETFPDYQFCLVEKTTGAPVARGHSIPRAFNSNRRV
jgi:hypothetical protein